MDKDIKDLKTKIGEIEKLLREDLSIDKKQEIEIPDEEAKLDRISAALDEIKIGVDLLREEMKGLSEQIELLLKKLQDEEVV